MRPRGRRAWIVLPGAALLLLFPGAAAGRASGGYVIEQKEGRSVSRVTLLPQGMRYELFAPPRARRRAKPQVGLILRYRDAHLFLLDPEHRRYDSVSLAAAVSSYRKELAASHKGQPSERLPVRPGTRRTKGQAPLGRPRAHLRRLGLTRTIGASRRGRTCCVRGSCGSGCGIPRHCRNPRDASAGCGRGPCRGRAQARSRRR